MRGLHIFIWRAQATLTTTWPCRHSSERYANFGGRDESAQITFRAKFNTHQQEGEWHRVTCLFANDDALRDNLTPPRWVAATMAEGGLLLRIFFSRLV